MWLYYSYYYIYTISVKPNTSQIFLDTVRTTNNDQELVETRNTDNNTLLDEQKSHVDKNLHISSDNYVQRDHCDVGKKDRRGHSGTYTFDHRSTSQIKDRAFKYGLNCYFAFEIVQGSFV